METNKTNTTTTQDQVLVDTVAEDFRISLFIVSLIVNLSVFVSWLAITMS